MSNPLIGAAALKSEKINQNNQLIYLCLIVISMKKLFLLLLAVLSIGLVASAQTRTVRGTVVEAENNEPAIGVSVKAVGASASTVTDVDGKFSLVVPVSVKQLTFSMVGMKEITVPISDNMNVAMEAASNTLDAVVVTGYGSAKKLGTVVGSVNVVGEKVLEDTPATNFVDALQGQVPGLAIYSNTGEPSAVAGSIRIRGVNSISASNTPLFICDGAPVSSAIFNSLSNSDIENITVLKDASSTAIYGSRAANGVIVITTKRGKFEQKASVTIRANVGWSDAVQDKLKMMGSEDYIKYRDMLNSWDKDNKVLYTGGASVSQAERDAWEKYGISTKWRDELIDNGAPVYSLEGTVRGGGVNHNYYFSLNHRDQDGVIFRSGIRRESIRMSINSKVNDWFRAGINANLGYEKYQTNGNAGSNGLYTFGNPFFQSYRLFPYDSPRYYAVQPDGTIKYGEKAVWYKYSAAANAEFFAGKSEGFRDNTNLNTNLYEEITPIKGLTIRAAQALTAFDYRSTSKGFLEESFTTPMGDFVDMSSFSAYRGEAFQRYYQFTYTNTVEYKKNIGLHDFTVLLGQESILSHSRNFSVTTHGQPNKYLGLMTSGTKVEMSDIGQGESETVMNSWFGQASYSYNNRYFVDLSLRRDGSSKFAKDNRWSTFWSAGAMWNIKKEEFMQPYTWLTDAKIRFNYGTTGNSGIGDYAFMGSVGNGPIYNTNPSYALGSPDNNSLTWETVEQYDLGLSAGFWNRLNVSVDFYLKNTKDMLMSVPVSVQTGYTGLPFNIGSMRNKGIDLEISGVVYNDKDWNVGLRANIGYNKNEITELFDGKDSYNLTANGLILEVGSDVHQIRTVRYKGVEPETGRQMWLDQNGEISYEYKDEYAVPLGKSYNAPWTGGFGLDARWKDISLRADFSWAAQKYMFNWARNWYSWTAYATENNQITDMLNMWQKPGDVTDIPNRFDIYGGDQTANNPRADDRWLENASFLRLKNLTIAYSLPKKWMKAAHLESVNLHFTGRNLLTFTGFTGQDPEIENNAVYISYPNTRQYEFGIDVTF